MNNKFFLEIYGCQMNVSDSLELEESLKQKGWEKTNDPTLASAVIINTCAVRQTAEDRAFRRLGYYKYLKKTQKLIIVFMGCVAQKEKEKVITSYPFVDYVIGPKNRHLIPDILVNHKDYSKKQAVSTRVFASLDENAKEFLDSVPDAKVKERAFITIINGCSKFCTYCIVPFTRGLEKSIPSSIILQNIKDLVQKGVREIYLLGQNVNSYGADASDISFARLLKLIGEVEGVERIKFISSHPRDLSDELIEEMARNSKVSRNFHLALQSGADEILRRMNRQHTFNHFSNLITKLRKAIPDISVSTDIIVGFPGETQSEFNATLKAMEEIRFSNAFIYMYSQRSGTAAANFNDSISPETKQKRVQELIDIQHAHTKEYLVSLIGKTVTVLVEGQGKEENQLFGFNEYDVRTLIKVKENPLQYKGQMLTVLIDDIIGHNVVATLNEENLN